MDDTGCIDACDHWDMLRAMACQAVMMALIADFAASALQRTLAHPGQAVLPLPGARHP
jgi:hypothetical protein